MRFPFESGKDKSRIGSISKVNVTVSPDFTSFFSKYLSSLTALEIDACGSLINQCTVSNPLRKPEFFTVTDAISLSVLFMTSLDNLMSLYSYFV